MELPYVRLAVAASVSLLMARSGLKKKSLSKDGAAAAVTVGFLSMGASYRFGATLLSFYYSSSKLTKVGHTRKAELEESVKEGGQRTYVQVFSCSIIGVAIAVAHVVCFGFEGDHTALSFASASGRLSAVLRCAYLGHFACCAADTWASEVGTLASGQPWLMTSCKKVPPGTNGGVSLLGTAAAMAGGAFMGLVFWLAGWLQMGRPDALTAELLPLVLIGLLAGLVGSTIDSALGDL